jgi:signal transduction histidine kinase
MKSIRIGIALFVLFVIGIVIFTRILIRQEEKYKMQEVLDKGDYLVSLIALYPIRNLEGEQRNFFLRTLTEYTSNENLAYLFIHDHTGHHLVSLAPYDISSKIPKDINMRSLYTKGLTKQTFKISGMKYRFYEFAKPIFENGERTGTARLGLKFHPISYFSSERISLMALVAFFIFASISIGYYWITLDLRSVRNLGQNLKNTCLGSEALGTCSEKNGLIAPIIEEIELSLAQFKEKLDNIEKDKMKLTSQLGVLTFKKNQIVNILDSIKLGIIVTNIEGNIVHINDYMLNLLHRTREEVLDLQLDEILEHDEINSFISQREGVEQTVTMDHIKTTFPELASGEIFQISFSYLTDSEGVVIGNVISAKNITMEESTEKAKHEFIANVAHELRTPLTTIKSYNEMLMGDEIDDVETQKEFYNTINKETDWLAQLIENLINISKIEMGGLSLDRGFTKTDGLVQDCIAAIETLAQEKHITIEKNLPDKFPSLVGDKELLRVALINVLVNAVKYTPENGIITFGLAENDNAIIFEVIDTGYGISKEDLPHIFNKFHRSSDPNIAGRTGSGLGLAISFEIIHLHHGKIEVRSEPGQGSYFNITIPKEQYYLGAQQ